jgi:tryptophan synthase alpha chain
MNRINKLFQTKKDHILSVYFTAGYPTADSTIGIIKSLQDAGVDMVEIGIPFSDPMADGPVIQQSSSAALKNGMNLRKLFAQLTDIRNQIEIPLLLMGYLNPVLQFGMEKFCRECADTGIDGLILPDLPAEIFELEYSEIFSRNGLANILLITPQTSPERVRAIDQRSIGFIYMVSSSSTTGVKGKFSNEQIDYFRRIQQMNLKNPVMAGFGISDHETYETVCQYARGAIIGSAFVKMIGEAGDLNKGIDQFVSTIRK